jgi:hypothetical protein
MEESAMDIATTRAARAGTTGRTSLGVILATLAAMLVCGLAACKPKPEDEVVKHYEAGEEAIRVPNAEVLVSRLTDESLAFYKECLSLAQSCPERELRKKEPYTLATVIKMRNRIDPKRLRMMTVNDYFAWRLETGDFVVDADYGVYPFRTVVSGDDATLQMGIEVQQRGSFRVGRRGGGLVRSGVSLAMATRKKLEPIDYKLSYKKVNGVWKDDLVAESKSYAESMRVEAQRVNTSVDQLIASIEEEESGGLSDKVWQPILKIKR